MRTALIGAVAAIALSNASAAQQATSNGGTIRLICDYESTKKVSTGQVWSLTGVHRLVSVAYDSGGRATITVEFDPAPYTGNITDEAIDGKMKRSSDDGPVPWTVHINRFTGVFKQESVNDTEGALVTFGTCRPATKQAF